MEEREREKGAGIYVMTWILSGLSGIKSDGLAIARENPAHDFRKWRKGVSAGREGGKRGRKGEKEGRKIIWKPEIQ